MRNVLEIPELIETPVANAEELEIRKANMSDIAPIIELINAYAEQGIMLPRTEFEMSENIRDFTVIYAGDRLVACGALHFYSPTSGEVRSLAVRQDAKRGGLGRLVIQALEAEAHDFGLHSIFAFTYVTGFFSKMGFEEVERGELPLKAWKDCLRCPKFQSCDEVAVVKYLAPAYLRHHAQEPLPDGPVQFPILRQ
ncbi:MAG TPA: N-acetyltransferase [Bryobacteraceae bacterium]|jgi:amino-acid N-acetyltransferase|nr:N-acetyltransferase [Bryobacteraceae bacterium]